MRHALSLFVVHDLLLLSLAQHQVCLGHFVCQLHEQVLGSLFTDASVRHSWPQGDVTIKLL
jgi:hypothetical protein